MITRVRRLVARLHQRLRPDPPPSHRRLWHSVSSTREYEGCPRRYRFGYLDKQPQDRPVPPNWRFGSVVHEGLEAAYRLAMEDPEAARASRLEAAVAAIEDSWERHDLGPDTEERQRAVWHVTRALARDALAVDDCTILGVEMAFRGELTDDDRLVGFADLVLLRPEGTVEIVDHKVTRRRSMPEQLHDDFQLNLYGHLARLQWPDAPAIAASHHYPTGPAAVRTVLDPDRMAAAHDRVRTTAARIRQDNDFAPTPSERCSHCPWQPSCPEGTAHLATAEAGRAGV